MNRSFNFAIATSVLFVVIGCAPSGSSIRSAGQSTVEAPAESLGPIAADQKSAKKKIFAPKVVPEQTAEEEDEPVDESNANSVGQPDQQAAEQWVDTENPDEMKDITTRGGITLESDEFVDSQGRRRKRQRASPACIQRAVSTLQKYSPSGYFTYQRLADKTVFADFVGDCSDEEYFYFIDLPTAVHESNHMIRSETGSYHLVSNEMLKVPSAKGYFPPMEMDTALLAHLKRRDNFYNTYLAPSTDASSKDDFTYLLDELNAYTNDFQSANDFTKVRPLTQRQIGLPALMSFVSFYVGYAHAKHVDVWNKMNGNGAMKTALQKLWAQAETTLTEACQHSPEGTGYEAHYVKHLCDANAMSSMATILGRKPVCPSACQ